MSTSRRAQFEASEPLPEEVFVRQLCQFARDNLEVYVAPLDDQALAWRVGSGISRARSHGFTWQSSIATFVTLMFRFAPNFDEYPPIRAILEAADADQEGRADQLMSVSGEHWEAVEERFDPLAWYEFGPEPWPRP